jgi:rhodanese-related sulfurtransferase
MRQTPMRQSSQPREAAKSMCRAVAIEASFIVLIASVSGLLFTAVAGRGFFQTMIGLSGPGVPEVTTSTFLTFEEAQALYDRHVALFIDSRYAYDFGIGHIKGAVNIPLHDFDTVKRLLDPLPRDQVIITYCDGEECSSSIELARLLHASGFVNVKIFFGGWNEWRTHNQPTEP